MFEQQALQGIPSYGYKRKTCPCATYSSNIWNEQTKAKKVHSSPLQVNPASSPALSGFLGLRIPDIMYLLYIHTYFVNQAPEKKKIILILRPPTVHEPVIPLNWAVLVDLTISVLSEIQNYFSKVIQQSWVRDDDCFKAWHPPYQLIPVLWSDIQQ